MENESQQSVLSEFWNIYQSDFDLDKITVTDVETVISKWETFRLTKENTLPTEELQVLLEWRPNPEIYHPPTTPCGWHMRYQEAYKINQIGGFYGEI